MIDIANILLTTSCNNSCIWCYGGSRLGSDAFMTENTFDIILNKLREVKCHKIVFSGGEPTLHESLFKFITKSIDSHIKQIYIITNGSNLTEEFLTNIEPIKKYIQLNISIHGSSSSIHDRITRNSGSFEKLILGAKLALKKRIKINAQVTLCKENKNDLTQIATLLHSIGIYNLLINYCNKPINIPFDLNDFLTISEFAKQIIVSLSSFLEELQIQVGPPLPLCELNSTFKSLIKNNKLQLMRGCAIMNNRIIIDFQGNILLCSHIPTIVLGNICSTNDCQQTLEKINREIKRPLQRYPYNKCNICTESTDCFMGGCPILRLYHYNYNICHEK